MQKTDGFIVGPIVYTIGLIAVASAVGYTGYTQLMVSQREVTAQAMTQQRQVSAARTLAANSVLCGAPGEVVNGVTCGSAGFTPPAPDALPSDPALPSNTSILGTGGGVIPASVPAPKADGRGRLFLYCVADSTTLTGTTSSIASNPAYTVISAGSDGVADTSCANALADSPQNDDVVQRLVVSDALDYASSWNRLSDTETTFGAGAPSGARVGIGTNSPSEQLDVNGNANVSGNLTVGGTTSLSGDIGTSGDISARNITASANVGVAGSVSANSASLTNPLAVVDGGTGAATASGARTSLGATATGDALFTAADATSGRTTLGLGTMATQDSSAVSVTGGTIAGIADLAIADGGTGASTAAGARANLGADDASNLTAGTLPAGRLPALTGDVSSTVGSASVQVVGLQGRSVETTAPADGEGLGWDGVSSSWKPMVLGVPATGDTGAVAGQHDHDGRYYTEGELNTSGAGGAVHWNNVTNKPSFTTSLASLTDTSISSPVTGQGLRYDGANWVNDYIGNAPIGTMLWFTGNNCPAGTIEANGAAVSASTYASLYNAIGYTYGGSGGTFNLPDLRGEFVRGWDNGRGIDSGRTFGTSQLDQIQDHSHDLQWQGGGAANRRVAVATDGNGVVGPSDDLILEGVIRGRVGAETRPRNLALLPCIVNSGTVVNTTDALPSSGGAMTGALTIPDGTAAAPSLNFAGSPATGLFSPAADTFGISTGGVERLKIDANGNIRIGASTHPDAKILITDNAVDTFVGNVGFLLRNNASQDYLNIWNYGPDMYAIAAADESGRRNLLLQPGGGSVGVGSSLPRARFEVLGADPIFSRIARFSTGAIYQGVAFSGATATGYDGRFLIQSDSIPGSGIADHLTHFSNAGCGGAGCTIHHVAIDGTLGVGRMLPASALDVQRQGAQSTSLQTPTLMVRGGNYVHGGANSIGFGAAAHSQPIGIISLYNTDGGSDLYLGTSTNYSTGITAWTYVDRYGRLFVGQSGMVPASSYALNVAGNTHAIVGRANSYGVVGYADAMGGNAVLGKNMASGFYGHLGTGSYGVYSAGNGYSSGSWISGSDRRWKEHVKPIDGALDKVMAMRGVFYDWKESSGLKKMHPGRQLGVIAQEVETVLPEVVTVATPPAAEPGEQTPEQPEDEEPYKGVAYDRLTALLIEAVKELKHQGDATEATVAALQATICASGSAECDNLPSPTGSQGVRPLEVLAFVLLLFNGVMGITALRRRRR